MKISHEFPLQFYKNDFAEKYTDYDYCLVHRYLKNDEYKSYFLNAKKKERQIFLDNSLYELGSSFSGDTYANVIKELKPDYYFLPDVFNSYYPNIKSQIDFYEKYKDLPSKPIAIPHGISVSELIEAVRCFGNYFNKAGVEFRIAIPFGSAAFDNTTIVDPWMYKKNEINYDPLRMAYNRKRFIWMYSNELSKYEIHLLGCKNIAEFDIWENAFKKDFIKSIDTSLPVAMTLENDKVTYEDRFIKTLKIDGRCDMHFYKPNYLIDKHFDDHFDINMDNLSKNINFFKDRFKGWYNNGR